MDISALVTHCYDVLKGEQDLSPANPIINAVLGNYVSSIANSNVQDNLHVLSDKGVLDILPALHEKLSQSEYCMERHFAQAFLRKEILTYADFEQFIYWDNYRELSDKEVALLSLCCPVSKTHGKRHVVFVGSGPLPMSAIIMAHTQEYRLTCIDCDAEAVDLSSRLVQKLHMEEAVRVICCDGSDYDYHDADVVMVASLIPDKQIVLQAVKQSRMDRPTHVIVRSAEDLNMLLYCPFKESAFTDMCFKCLGKTDYCPKTINTSLLYEL